MKINDRFAEADWLEAGGFNPLVGKLILGLERTLIKKFINSLKTQNCLNHVTEARDGTYCVKTKTTVEASQDRQAVSEPDRFFLA